MDKSLWYSITPQDAFNRLVVGDRHRVKVEYTSGPTAQGILRHFHLTSRSFNLMIDRLVHIPGEHLLSLQQIIFKTDDKQIEVVLPGVVTFTIDLE